MRDIFQPDRAMQPASIRFLLKLIGGAFIFGLGLQFLATLYFSMSTIGDSGHDIFLITFADYAVRAGTLLGLYLLLRLATEILMAMHRQNDRLGILSDELRSVRISAPESDAADTKKDAD